MGRNFMQLLMGRFSQGFAVCVGLDPDYERIPQSVKDDIVKFDLGTANVIFAFNKRIVNATLDSVGAYKLNSAFYEAQGLAGWEALQKTIDYIQYVAPNIPVIYDAKRGDIGNSNDGYATAAFEVLKADAITVSPYLGGGELQPFFKNPDKGVFVLCHTSNKSAGEFQELELRKERSASTEGLDTFGDPQLLYEEVADSFAKKWNTFGNCCFVFGATFPEQLAGVRKMVGDSIPFLIPGIGKQGGDLEATVKAAKTSFVINSSRDIIFASDGPDFAEAAHRKVVELDENIRKYL